MLMRNQLGAGRSADAPSSITSARAIPVTGRMSLSPTLESTATLRKRSSIHVRGPAGLIGALKLPGRVASHAA